MGFGQKPQARGLALWRHFWGGKGREIALIGPNVTVALKVQVFSLYLNVPGSLSQTRIPQR